MPAALLPLACLTVMLWILWSDSARPGRPRRIIYFARAFLYLLVSVVLIYDLVRYPRIFSRGGAAMAIVAALVGIGGAGYFFVRSRKAA